MSADQLLHPAQFFHGSHHDFKVGDLVESPRTRAQRIRPNRGGEPYSYFSHDPEISRFYGQHVYKVEPTGTYDADPDEESAYRSEQPLRVVGKHDLGGTRGRREAQLDDALDSYWSNRK